MSIDDHHIKPQNIYLLGIGGTAMGSLAGMLKSLGHRVVGSDTRLYPPMSDKLLEWGIEAFEGYRVENITKLGFEPDLFVIGNVIRRDNPEAQWVLQNDKRYCSMPEAFAEFGIRDKHSVVVTGTHGKTTTTSILAETLLHMNADPSFMVAGALQAYAHSFRVGQGTEFVIEGDEYDTAFFDKGPKFLHYRAQTVVITSLEFDHADIYDSIEAIEASFRRLAQSLPAGAEVVVWSGADRALNLLSEFPLLRVYRYAHRPDDYAEMQVDRVDEDQEGTSFDVHWRGQHLGRFMVPLWGRFNIQNTLAALSVLLLRGYSPELIREGLKKIRGAQRRMQLLGRIGSGALVIDDFAHHPTAIAETVTALKHRWPKKRLWAVFEPRSATTRCNRHQNLLRDALGLADRVIIGWHPRIAELPIAEQLDPDDMAAVLNADADALKAWFLPQPQQIAEHLLEHTEANDVICLMSNGDFGGLAKILNPALESSD